MMSQLSSQLPLQGAIAFTRGSAHKAKEGDHWYPVGTETNEPSQTDRNSHKGKAEDRSRFCIGQISARMSEVSTR